MLNQAGRLETEPIALVRRMASLADVDAERLRHWLFARCVVESLRQKGSAMVWFEHAAVALAP